MNKILVVVVVVVVVNIHRDQAIVERFNKTLAERRFGHQYARRCCSDQEKDRLNG